MKKVVLSLALVAVLGLSFTSCKKSEGEATEGADTTVVETPAEPVAVDTAATTADTATTPADTTAAAPVAPAH